MGICGRIMSLYRREEPPEDKRGKACLANGNLYTINHTPHLRVRDICIEIAKLLDIAPVALDFFTLMTTDCEHCLRPNRQVKQQCDKQNDHYLNPKRVLHAEEIASKVFFFRLAFKAVPGPDLKLVNKGAYEYFVKQCRWDFINGRINNLTRKDHLTLLVLESIIRAHEEGISSKEILENPKRFGLAHMFVDDDYSCREIKNHLKRQLPQFKTAQSNADKAKDSFLFVLEGVTDFGVTKVVVKKFYYQNATEDGVYPVEWEILISANGLKKRRTYKDERDDDNDDATGSNRVDEMISDYKDIEYLEIKQSASEEIIHISRLKGFLEVISVGKSMIKKESLITLIEGFYHLLVNQYKTLTKYESGLELPIPSTRQNRKLHIHGPIERKKVESLLKAVETVNGDRSGVHMIRRSRNAFDSYVLSLIHGCEIKHFEILQEGGKYGLKNGQRFESLTQLLEFYKTEQRRFPTKLTKYCPIPREGLCALYDDQIVVEAPCVPSTSRPANPEYLFEYIGNLQLEKLDHPFTNGGFGNRIFKARWMKGDNGGGQEVFCRRVEPSRAVDFREKVVECGENMAALVHRNLVMFHGVCFYDEQNTYLTFEWIGSGTLDDYLTEKTEVTVETIITFAAQIAEACMFLHEKNYVHGWLAAHNVLIVNEDLVKVSDVSVPCLREQDMLTETVSINRSPWKARECFQGRKYSKESDVWAFGVVLWEMFMKTKPFQNMTDDVILQVYQQGHHLACPKCCPEEVGKIMKSCWITDPSHRPTFANIVVKLRQIMTKLTPQEKERKIRENIDEKFTIEPLVINKPSLAMPDENLPRSLSCSTGNYDCIDETPKDIGSDDGTCMSSTTDESHLDLIPEKELPEMLWSPEEIEMKKFQGKYPRPTVTMEQPANVTYDRIGQMDSSFETSEETQLLPLRDESFGIEAKHLHGLILNEVQTAGDPRKHQERLTEDGTTSSEYVADNDEGLRDNQNVPRQNRRHPDSNDVQPSDYDRLSEDTTEDDPTDDEQDEERPLISETNASLAQTNSIFASLETMDHMGFLASQLGDKGKLVDNGSTLVDKNCSSMDNVGTLVVEDTTMEPHSTISDNESTGAPKGNEVSSIFSGNLDPFAVDSEDRASEIFSKLNSINPTNSENLVGKRAAPGENKYISNTRFAANFKRSEYNSGKLNPMMGKGSPNSPYILAGTKPSHSSNQPSSHHGRPKNAGYISSPGSRTKTREHGIKSSRNDDSYSTGNRDAFTSGVVEFSKLDPFAISSSAISGSESEYNDGRVIFPNVLNDIGQRSSMQRPPVASPVHRRRSANSEQNHQLQNGSLFSSFLNRDPMSEVSLNEGEEAISPSVHEASNTYVSPYSLGLKSYNPRERSQLKQASSTASTSPNLQLHSGQALNKHTNRGGYVSMPGNIPPGRRAISRNAVKESTNQKSDPKSDDGPTFELSLESFSQRDPFSEAAAKENKVVDLHPGNSRANGAQNLKPRGFRPPGVSCPNVRPTVITGATFENLFSKSRDAKSTGVARPGIVPPGSASPDMRPRGLVPSSSPRLTRGAIPTNPSALNPHPVIFRPPSVAKSSFANLALKLSESKQSSPKHNVPKPATSEGVKPTYKSGSYQPSKTQNIVSTTSKKSGYVAVSSSKNTEHPKSSKVYAIDEQNATSISHDFASLSNRDVFADILQCGSTVVSDTSRTPASSVSPLANKPSGVVKLYTMAESDKDPYQKVSTPNTQGKKVETKSNYVHASVPRSSVGLTSANNRFAERGEKDESTLSSCFKRSHSPTSKVQTDSNYLPTFDSTTQQRNIAHSVRDATSKDRNSEKPRAKTPEQENESKVNELDISQFSQATLEDLLSGMAFENEGEINKTRPPQEIELKQRASHNPLVDVNTTEAVLPNATENVVDNEVHARVGMDTSEHEASVIGLTFDDRDPFAEISSSQPHLNRKSSQEINVVENSQEKGSGEPNQHSKNAAHFSELAQSGEMSKLGNESVVVTSYSNAPPPELYDQQEPNDRTPREISSGTPPGGENGETPPPSGGEKPKVCRNMSDIGIEYAQVSIRQGTSYEEPVVGAEGGSETGLELPEEDIPVETVPDADNDQTVVDPFNMHGAEESIQQLDPYRSPKPGNRVGETFEESMRSHQIPFENLTFNERDRELGRGAFGVVRKAKLTRSGHGHVKRPAMDVAVKCLKDDASEIYKNSFKQEAINLMKLDNKFIVRFLGVSYNEEKNLLLVTELVPQGSLDKYLRDPKNMKILGNEVLLQFAIQITMGMQYLESKKLVHRDLAARNILVATESHVKISDFGLSRIYDDEYYRSHRENQKLPIRWLAPECLEQKKFTVYSDVWSLGVTLWEMFSYGKRPYDDCNFKSANELIQYLKSGKQLVKPPACPDEIYAHVQECWHLYPLRRISFFLLKTLLEVILKDKYANKPYFM